MNIGFFDPISERWIKPRPEKEPEVPVATSLGEALLAATEAAVVKARNEKIWEYLKQCAEGVNMPTAAPVSEPVDWANAPPLITEVPPEYAQPSEPVIMMQERTMFVPGGLVEIKWSGPLWPIEPIDVSYTAMEAE